VRNLAVAGGLLWLAACSNPELEQKVADLEAQVATLETEKATCEEERAKLETESAKRVEDFKALLADVDPLIKAGVLSLEVVNGKASMSLSSDVLFASGSADLSDDGKNYLGQVAKILARRTDQSFQVEGHTDDEAISTALYPTNWHLAAARSVNVVAFMLANGMPPDRLSAASYGQHQPIVPNRTEVDKARNRRIEIVLMPDLSQLPGYDDLVAEYGRKATGPGRAVPADGAVPVKGGKAGAPGARPGGGGQRPRPGGGGR
jgi:chemotaxis protein MotB